MSDMPQQREDFHTKLFPKDYALLKRLSLKYGSIQNTIEKAIHLLRIKESLDEPEIYYDLKKENLSKYTLSEFMLHDFKMLAVGRRTFLSYIENLPQAPIEDNNALELIEWFYHDKYEIKRLTLLQILKAIKTLWMAGNYFTKVVISPASFKFKKEPKKPEQNQFKIIFYHDFNDRKYGQYWMRYFKHILTNSPIEAQISQEKVRPQSFYFTVQRLR